MKKNIVIAHVREITHVFGEKIWFECHANTCGQAHVSHNDTHILHITQTQKRLETEQHVILNDRGIQFLCNWDAAAKILHQLFRKADFFILPKPNLHL